MPSIAIYQYVLNFSGANLTVDGNFGPATRNAVINYQRANSLSPDGIVGKNTWQTLLTLPPYPTLRRGSRGTFVAFAQGLLESNLIPVGAIDGIFGIGTENAVKTFQSSRGLTPDGIIGQNTWRALAIIE